MPFPPKNEYHLKNILSRRKVMLVTVISHKKYSSLKKNVLSCHNIFSHHQIALELFCTHTILLSLPKKLSFSCNKNPSSLLQCYANHCQSFNHVFITLFNNQSCCQLFPQICVIEKKNANITLMLSLGKKPCL